MKVLAVAVPAVAVGLTLLGGATMPPAVPATHRAAEAIVPNENRTPAGRLAKGVLTLALEARAAAWHLEGPRGPGVSVMAFAEVGKPPSVPGPLVRVNAGTEIRATVRNATAKRLVMRGLQDHASGVLDSVAIEPGATHEFRFRVDIPGTFFYHGRTETARLFGGGQDSQLVGAFIVDPVGTRPLLGERVFMITSYWDTVSGLGVKSARSNELQAPFGVKPNEYVTWAVNGLTWPHTERLAYTVGDTVRWRVINGGFGAHPMHLHGFYYDILSRGDVLRDTLYSSAERRKVVTEPMYPRSTLTMQWVPSRAGNWLYHCHLVDHIDGSLRLGSVHATHGANHAEQEMAGLVMGLKVSARPGAATHSDPVARRALRLFVNERPNVYRDRPGYGFVLQEGETAPASDSVVVPSSTIVLRRNEPTEITVINRSRVMASVHWHGIELESFYDGVGGWSGWGDRVAQPIAPGDSFLVRLTPDRAGTFIYHTHGDETEQLPSGLYGSLIVLPENATRDTTERILLLGSGGPHGSAPASLNGSTTPPPIELRAGVRHRLRLINIAAAEAKRVRLVGDSTVLWRAVAKDGADLPTRQATVRPAAQLALPGETFDFDVTRQKQEVLSLEIITLLPRGGTAVMRVPVIVR